MNSWPSPAMCVHTPFSFSTIQRCSRHKASSRVSLTMASSPASLLLAWKAANQIYAKWLIPFLPTLVEALDRHGHLHLTEECRNQLRSMSATLSKKRSMLCGTEEWNHRSRLSWATIASLGKMQARKLTELYRALPLSRSRYSEKCPVGTTR